jgi:hypothetical protein
LIRSPDFTGTSVGATTSQCAPSSLFHDRLLSLVALR